MYVCLYMHMTNLGAIAKATEAAACKVLVQVFLVCRPLHPLALKSTATRLMPPP